MKLEAFDSSYFHGKILLVMVVFKMFVYRPVFNTLELKTDKSTDYVIGWKSKSLIGQKFHLELLHVKIACLV